MEIYYRSILVICVTINFVAFLTTLRRLVEAYLIKKAEIDLERARLELKAHLIGEREERFNALNAERLIRAGRDD